MDPQSLPHLALSEVARQIRDGALSPRQLTEVLLARIAAVDPALHSYAQVMADSARREAERAEAAVKAGHALGPLHGVPVAVKDLFWTEDAPTAAGMTIHRDFRPAQDAAVVARLRAAGAVILGKLQMTEGAFATHHPSVAAPLNPWGAAHWPGASSSGAGVATAAGLCYGALGSDTGGSIRFPCAANGLTGIKPTWGRVSRHGTFELAASLDHVGPLARSAEDAAVLLSLIAGPDPRDPTTAGTSSLASPEASPGASRGLAGLRIAVDPGLAEQGCDAETVAMIAEVARAVRGAGAETFEAEMGAFGQLAPLWETAAGTEAAVAHAQTYPARADDYGPALARLLDIGRASSAEVWREILLARLSLRQQVDALLAQADLLLLPVQPLAAPTLEALGALAADPEANSRLIRYTSPFNFTGHPAISLPAERGRAGLPLGFQLVAAHGREDLLCTAGIALQQHTAWHRAMPADPTVSADDSALTH